MTRSIERQTRQKLKVEWMLRVYQDSAFFLWYVRMKMPPCCLKIFIYIFSLLAGFINFSHDVKTLPCFFCLCSFSRTSQSKRIKYVYNNLWYWRNLLFGHDKQIKMQIIIKLNIVISRWSLCFDHLPCSFWKLNSRKKKKFQFSKIMHISLFQNWTPFSGGGLCSGEFLLHPIKLKKWWNQQKNSPQIHKLHLVLLSLPLFTFLDLSFK